MRWVSGEVCVAQEHVVANFIRQRLLALTQLHAPFSNGPRLVCACAPGELHELGLLMFALLMEQRGWELVYVGQSLSPEGLAEFLTPLRPALVVLSATMTEHAAGLLELATIVDSLRSQRIALAYSGRVFERNPELRHHVPGLFLGLDLREAVARADALRDDLDPDRWYAHAGMSPRMASHGELSIGG
jgi:hypothetical protein